MAAAVAVLVPRTAEGASPMPPDLRPSAVGCPGGFGGDPLTCSDWDVCPVSGPAAPRDECLRSGPAESARLRFTSSADNVGDGPPLLFGRRDSTDEPTTRVRQAF